MLLFMQDGIMVVLFFVVEQLEKNSFILLIIVNTNKESKDSIKREKDKDKKETIHNMINVYTKQCSKYIYKII